MATFRKFLEREKKVKLSLLFILCLATWNENVRTSALPATSDHETEGTHPRDLKAVNWGERSSRHTVRPLSHGSQGPPILIHSVSQFSHGVSASASSGDQPAAAEHASLDNA